MSKSYSEQYEDMADWLNKLTDEPEIGKFINNDVLNITILGAIGKLLASLCDEVRALRETIERKE